MLSLFLPRNAAASTRSPIATSRLEVCPPTRRRAKRGWLQKLTAACFPWLAGKPSRADRRLVAVSADFVMALNDVHGTRAVEMRARVRNANSMRELWHLRTAVHNLIALTRGESEADIRLAYLGRHFPTRNPRSGFAPFDGASQ